MLYWFIKEYAKIDGIKIVGCNTFMEHHEILKRIQQNCDVVIRPKMKPFEIKNKYGSPCFSKIQDEFIERYQRGSRTYNTMKFVMGTEATIFKLNKKAREYLLSGNAHKISNKCCKYLKKLPFKDFEKDTGLKAILGVRGNEGKLRKAQYTSCFTKDKKFTPLWDMTNEIEEQIYQKYNIEKPDVYKYVDRTGCMGCPYGTYKHDTEKEISILSAGQRKFVCEYFKESYKVLNINTNIEKGETEDG